MKVRISWKEEKERERSKVITKATIKKPEKGTVSLLILKSDSEEESEFLYKIYQQTLVEINKKTDVPLKPIPPDKD